MSRFGWRTLYAALIAGVVEFLLAGVRWVMPFSLTPAGFAAAFSATFVFLFVLDPMSDDLANWRTIAWRGPGFCERCGYDLRASPDRCPECGTPVAAPADRV